MTEQQDATISVPRNAHYSFVGDPDEQPDELWYLGHGYGQLARRFIGRFSGIAAPGRWLVAPEGLSRYYTRGTGGTVGASWMTREDREIEIEDYLRFLDLLHGHLVADLAQTPRLVFLGFSQGCATVSRWAARGKVPPSRLILWGEVQAHDLTGDDLQRLVAADVRVQFVIGRADPFVSLAAVERAAGALTGAGLAVEVVEFDGGHEIDSGTVPRLVRPPSESA